MFLKVSNVDSTMVKDLQVDASRNLAIVEYNNGGKYPYADVDFSALYDLIYKQTDSIGRWVINSCKLTLFSASNSDTFCTKVTNRRFIPPLFL